jgi:hypothetical protein
MPTRSPRVSALDDVGDPDAPPGSGPWARWMVGQAKLRRHDLRRDVAGLQEILAKLDRHSAWKSLGFLSLAVLCRAELGLDAREVGLIRQAREGTTLGAVLGKRGRPKKGEEKGANGTLKRGSNRAPYLRARLERDHKDILAALDRGEYRSVRAAGVAAGVVKVPTALEAARRAARKLTGRDRAAFVRWVAGGMKG